MITEPRADLDTERAILGHILDGDAWAAYAGLGLSSDDFFREAHRHVFAAAAAIDADDEPVAMLPVLSRLRELARLDDAGGAAYLFSMVDGLPKPDAAMVRYCASRVRGLAVARRAAYLAQRLASDQAIDAAALSAHAAAIDALVEQHDQQGTDAPAQVAALYAAREHERQMALRVGVPELDETLDGLRAGEVCGIMARTSVGKTLVACHIASTLAGDGAGVVFVSLEMAQGQIVERLARLRFGLTRHQLRWAVDNGRFAASDYIAHFSRLDVLDTPGITLQGIERRVRTIQRQRPVSAVVIDYLGLVGADRNASTYDRMSQISRDLKDVAKRLGVVVVPLIQVSRSGGDDGAQELALGAARDSGVTEEAVDYLIALRRLDRSTRLGDADRDKYRDVIFAKVVKNRHGMVSLREVALRVDPSCLALSQDDTIIVDEHTNARTRKAEVRL